MLLQRLKLLLAPIAWPVLSGSWRLHSEPDRADVYDPPVIFACLHRDFLPAIAYVRPASVVLLVSNSPDGDILVRTLRRRNYDFVRGSTGVDGGRAFVSVRRQLEAGRNVGLAIDGPEGPFGAIHEGVLLLARLTGAPIVPLIARTSRPVVLPTWDRTMVPLPWSRVEIHCGEPLHLPQNLDEAGLSVARRELKLFFGVEGAGG